MEKVNFSGLASNTRSMAMTGETPSKVIQTFANSSPVEILRELRNSRDFKTIEK